MSSDILFDISSAFYLAVYLAVEVHRSPVDTDIGMGPSGAHCDRELAVEVLRSGAGEEASEEEKEKAAEADTESFPQVRKNPFLISALHPCPSGAMWLPFFLHWQKSGRGGHRRLGASLFSDAAFVRFHRGCGAAFVLCLLAGWYVC